MDHPEPSRTEEFVELSSDRELLDLCYGGVMTIREIAARLDRSADGVYHSLQRIRYVLLECINRAAAREESAS